MTQPQSTDPPTDPVDELHSDCLNLREAIRRRTRRSMSVVDRWEPRPCPPDWWPS